MTPRTTCTAHALAEPNANSPNQQSKNHATTNHATTNHSSAQNLLAEASTQICYDIDQVFEQRLTATPAAPSTDTSLNLPRERLYTAMRYAAIGGGKRLRPLLVRAAGDLFHVKRDSSLIAGAAVEAMHVYSLIHDDLPCMDDDDIRRGKPSLHRAFDEATAVLAGDALHALAFEWLARCDVHSDARVRTELLLALAKAAGPAGMAGGQMMDMAAQTTTFDMPTIRYLQQLKTGALISFSVEAGAILGRAPAKTRRLLLGYARDIGLAFQIVDDIMDVVGDENLVGKALKKDHIVGKATFVTLMGIEQASIRARKLAEKAAENLADFGSEAELLHAIAHFVIERDH